MTVASHPHFLLDFQLGKRYTKVVVGSFHIPVGKRYAVGSIFQQEVDYCIHGIGALSELAISWRRSK
jgi:hypothetical protein